MTRKKVDVDTQKPVESVGIHKFKRSENTAVPFGDGGSVRVDITETIVDRRAGTRSIERKWGDKPNLNIIVDEMERAPDLRSEVAEFFMARAVYDTIYSLTPTNTLKPGEKIFQAPDVFKNIAGTHGTQVAVVASEFVVPFLRRLNMIAETGVFTTEVYHETKQVWTGALTEDIVAQEVVRIAESIKLDSLSDSKYTRETFASAVAEALLAVGDAFLNVTIYSDLIDDIVKGIRASIFIGRKATHNGEVPREWRDNPVVRELSRNYVFVRAAMQFEPGASITPVNPMYRLEERAPLVLAAIKMSNRYAIVGAKEYVRTFGKRTVRDTKRIARCFVGWRAARPAAVAQSVTAFKDAVLPNVAMNISSANAHVDKFLSSGYADTSKMGTDVHAKHFARMVEHAVEGGFRPDAYGYTIVVGDDAVGFNHELACLISAEVRLVAPSVDVEFQGPLETGDFLTMLGDDSQWIFGVRTKEAFLDEPSSDGKFYQDMFYTNNVGEALLVADDFEPSTEMEVKPQLLSTHVLNTRLVGFDRDASLQNANIRVSFDVTVGGVDVRGSIRTSEIGFLATTEHTYIVKPRFNAEVIAATAKVFNGINVLLSDIREHNEVEGQVNSVPAPTIDFIKRQKAVMLLEMARGVSKTYRHAIHQAIAMKALRSMSADDAILARGQISQQQFGGYADVFGLIVFLASQGIPYDFAADIVSSADMVPVLMEYGSDRV